MSLSDKHDPGEVPAAGNSPGTSPVDEFKPIDLKSLDSFQEEKSNKTPETQPDLERFQMLFEPEPLGEKADVPVSFEALYSFGKADEDGPFEPLVEGAGEGKPAESVPGHGEEPGSGEEDKREIEPTPEELGFEKGYKEGFEKGLSEGEAKGEASGHEKGFQEGHSLGFEKGEEEGRVKGEKEGFEKGLEDGLEKAREQVREEAMDIIPPLKEALATADTLLDTMVERYEDQIIDLVHKISQKVVMARLELDDEIIRHTIMDALKSLVAPEKITLSVSPEDYEYIEMIREEFFASFESLKHVAVMSDPLIKKGGCRIETATASISTDPESKLNAVYEAMKTAGRA